LIGALFFFGYFAGQIPGAIYAERNSPKKLIFACLILWGVFSTLTGLVSNVPALMVVRFLLGVVEAAVFPSLLIFINHWFSKSERSVANATTVLATTGPAAGCATMYFSGPSQNTAISAVMANNPASHKSA